jgi:hypothetical protein
MRSIKDKLTPRSNGWRPRANASSEVCDGARATARDHRNVYSTRYGLDQNLIEASICTLAICIMDQKLPSA